MWTIPEFCLSQETQRRFGNFQNCPQILILETQILGRHTSSVHRTDALRRSRHSDDASAYVALRLWGRCGGKENPRGAIED
jgi:hypothetical protein